MIRSLYINWKDDFNIGIPVVDEQHRGLVVLINSFHYALHEGYSDA